MIYSYYAIHVRRRNLCYLFRKPICKIPCSSYEIFHNTRFKYTLMWYEWEQGVDGLPYRAFVLKFENLYHRLNAVNFLVNRRLQRRTYTSAISLTYISLKAWSHLQHDYDTSCEKATTKNLYVNLSWFPVACCRCDDAFIDVSVWLSVHICSARAKRVFF